MVKDLIDETFKEWRDKAAKADEFGWFVFMLVFSLLGVPEIYYLHSRKKTL